MVVHYWNAKFLESLTDGEIRAIANNDYIIITQDSNGRRLIYNDPSAISDYVLSRIVNRLVGAGLMKAMQLKEQEQELEKAETYVINVDELVDAILEREEEIEVTQEDREALRKESKDRIHNFCMGYDGNLEMIVRYAWDDIKTEKED